MKRKLSFLERFATVPHVVWSVLFIVGPLLFVLWYAFTDTKGEFTFSNISLLSSYSHIFFLSICFALVATAICLLIGYPLAFVMSRAKPSVQKILMILLMLPMWISLLIRTYSLMTLLDNGGLVNSLLNKLGLDSVTMIGTGGAVILGMVYDFLPYMVLPIYTSMTKLDNRYLEAAADLGCNNWQTLWKVTMPLSIPGIVSGITMVFMPSVTTFFIPRVLGGGNTMMFGDLIEAKFLTEGNWNVGSALSLIMMVLILISLSILRKADPNGEGGGIA